MNEAALIIGIGFVAITAAAFALLWVIHRVALGRRPVALASGNRYIVGPAAASVEVRGSYTPGFDRWLARAARDTGLALSPAGATAAILGVGILLAVALFVAFENEFLSTGGLLLGVVVTLIVGLWLGMRRRRQVAAQLPGCVELLARSLRAGKSLEQALRASVEKVKGPLAGDLRRCAQQLELGLPVDAAFADLGSRYRSVELQMVIGAISMHRQSGGDLPTTLERLAVVAKQRLEYRRQIQAASSSARLAALLLAAAAPAIFLYYLYSQQFITNLLSDPSGQFALALAVGLELSGILWLLYLSRSEV